MLETFTLDTFRSRVGEDFQVSVAHGGHLSLRLESALGLDPHPRQGAGQGPRAPFSLLFHGPVDRLLRQGTYLVRHDAIGEFPLFLVPLGPEDGRMRYEAVFN